MNRHQCSDCPWSKDVGNYDWTDAVKEAVEDGLLETHMHRCHMITKHTWKESDNDSVVSVPETDLQVCIGSLKHHKSCRTS